MYSCRKKIKFLARGNSIGRNASAFYRHLLERQLMRENIYDGPVSFNPDSELALNVVLESAPNDMVIMLLLNLLEV